MSDFADAVGRYTALLEQLNDYLDRQSEAINHLMIERARLMTLEQRVAELATLDAKERMLLTGLYVKNGLLPVEGQ